MGQKTKMQKTYIECDFKGCHTETAHVAGSHHATMEAGWTSVNLIHGDGAPDYGDQTQGYMCPEHTKLLEAVIKGLPRPKMS